MRLIEWNRWVLVFLFAAVIGVTTGGCEVSCGSRDTADKVGDVVDEIGDEVEDIAEKIDKKLED